LNLITIMECKFRKCKIKIWSVRNLLNDEFIRFEIGYVFVKLCVVLGYVLSIKLISFFINYVETIPAILEYYSRKWIFTSSVPSDIDCWLLIHGVRVSTLHYADTDVILHYIQNQVEKCPESVGYRTVKQDMNPRRRREAKDWLFSGLLR